MSKWIAFGHTDECKEVFILNTKTLSIFVGKGHHLYPEQWSYCCPRMGVTSYRPLVCSIKGEAFNEAIKLCRERLEKMFKELEDV